MPDGVRDFSQLEEAASVCAEYMTQWLSAMAAEAGAVAPSIACQRIDEKTAVDDNTDNSNLWTNLIFEVKADMQA